MSTGGAEGETVVLASNHLMIGDNHDNSVDGWYFSADGRTWGFVPEANLVGSANRLWFTFDWGRGWKKLIDWSQVGARID